MSTDPTVEIPYNFVYGRCIGTADRPLTPAEGGFLTIRKIPKNGLVPVNLAVPAGEVLGLAYLVSLLFDSTWGAVEGIAFHRSCRGYYEIHVWTEALRGRAVEITVIDSGTQPRYPTTFADFEARCKSHGWQSYQIVPRFGPDVSDPRISQVRASWLRAAILAAVPAKPGSGGLT